MIKVLIVDDDEKVRNTALRCLARADVQLASAANGKHGLEQARRIRPDVVICDIEMPGLDGFELLESLRTDADLGKTLVMMLTSQTSRDAQRLGMTLGADDYLTKPFTDRELVSAFDGLLKKLGRMQAVVGAAVKDQEEYLRRIFAARLDGGPSGDRYGSDSRFESLETPSQILLQATVLFSDIRGFTSIAEKLTASEVANLLTEYFERACEPVIANGGQHLKMMGDGLMAVFTDQAESNKGESYEWPAPRRALAAALSMNELAKEFAHWVAKSFPGRGLPPFQTGFGIHCGEVAISQMGSSEDKVATAIGDTVNIAARLESSTKDLGWEIVASRTVVELAGEGVLTAAETSLAVRGKTTSIDVMEVKAISDMPDAMARTHRDVLKDMRDDFEANALIAARAVKGALGKKLAAFRNEREQTGSQLLLAGYKIVRRIGSGGMSSIYLATREPAGDLVVLKVLDARGEAADQMARFMREYSLLSTIRHPNIIRIYNQGFGEEHAYIAMEYFENGDLRSRMKHPLEPAVVVDITIQAARALSVIHALDIVHRDLKPENLMLRADGSIVLADFGIAKMVGTGEYPESTLTQAGELVGSPSYMSPEQVEAKMITHLSDLYSLGVMFYEMLTGERPYKGTSLMSLLAQQANAPPPKLPRGLEKFQPIVDRLMAKQPLRRYASAEALLADLAGYPSSHTLL